MRAHKFRRHSAKYSDHGDRHRGFVHHCSISEFRLSLLKVDEQPFLTVYAYMQYLTNCAVGIQSVEKSKQDRNSHVLTAQQLALKNNLTTNVCSLWHKENQIIAVFVSFQRSVHCFGAVKSAKCNAFFGHLVVSATLHIPSCNGGHMIRCVGSVFQADEQ